jgi:DNA-binding transcriptional ArsR family regulator
MPNPDANINQILHAIADPARRKILQALKEKGASSVGRQIGLCASDIEARVPLSQPTISHHTAVLRNAGLIEAKRMGQWILYRRREQVLRNFIKTLKRGL